VFSRWWLDRLCATRWNQSGSGVVFLTLKNSTAVYKDEQNVDWEEQDPTYLSIVASTATLTDVSHCVALSAIGIRRQDENWMAWVLRSHADLMEKNRDERREEGNYGEGPRGR
jgi:RES domain-containing protein